MERRDVTFDSGGMRCAAWLYEPDGTGPHPCVVIAGGLGAVREMRLDAYAERFAEAGFAALVFDYRYWGESEGRPRHLIEVKRQLEDWRTAFHYARSLEGIDPARVALWGASLSGGHVIEVAAGEPGVAAVIAQTPFTYGPATLRAIPTRTMLRAFPHMVRDALRGALGRKPHYMPLHGPPGSVAALTAPEADPGYRALVPAGAPWENKHTPRFGLKIGLYRPGKAAGRVQCPLLVCVCDNDETTPPEPAKKAAAKAARGELRHYPIGHFDIYFGDAFEQAVSDQVEFLERHLTRQEAAAPEAAALAAPDER